MRINRINNQSNQNKQSFKSVSFVNTPKTPGIVFILKNAEPVVSVTDGIEATIIGFDESAVKLTKMIGKVKTAYDENFIRTNLKKLVEKYLVNKEKQTEFLSIAEKGRLLASEDSEVIALAEHPTAINFLTKE